MFFFRFQVANIRVFYKIQKLFKNVFCEIHHCCLRTRIAKANFRIKTGDEAFRACSNLTEVVIPDSVTEIGSGAFDECDSLTEIHLPSLLRKLGMAFDNGPYEGRSIYVHFTDPSQCQEETLDDDEESTGWPSNWDDWLYVPKGCREVFEKAEPWRGFNEIKELDD